ncbi:MAG: AAA family ATPase [Planctomycetes bacterium]|nr:AAA family ATPase [Planctomycetota bacterium]
MRLRELEVEHFGVFSDQSLEFDAGFSLVFGPNEAGKSTLLQLIREMLFGFKAQQNPYVFEQHSGEMAGIASFDMHDGSQLRFRRRKGKKNEVVGSQEPSGREIDASALGQLTGGANKELYEQVFGFSLRELAEADDSLKRANLTEALYGGGLGGLANFQKAQTALQAEADALFTARGSKQQIHQLLSGIKRHAKDLKEATVKPRDFEQLVRESSGAADAVSALRTRREELRTRKTHLERLAAAITPWLRQQQAEAELGTLNVPDSFPLDGGERLQRLKVQRTIIANELATIEQELIEETDQIAALTPAPELVAREATIRQLEQQITQITGYRSDLPLRQQDSLSIKSRVLAKLRDFSPDWNCEHLERFQTTLAQRDEIDRLESKLDELTQRKMSLVAGRRTIQADISSLAKQLAQTNAAEESVELAALLERATAYQRDVDRLSDLQDQIRDNKAKVQALLAKLNSPFEASMDGGSALSLPLAATVVEFRARLKKFEEAVDEARRRLESARQEESDKQEQLAQFDARVAVPDREQLVATRVHRDAGWQIVRMQLLDPKAFDAKAVTKWIDNPTNVEATTGFLADAYEEAVADCDKLADERQGRAEQAATRDQLTFDIKRLVERGTTLEQHLAERLEQRSQLASEWKGLWSHCPFEPVSPDAMLDWLSVFDEFSEARSQLQRLTSRVDALQASVAEFEGRLAASFPGSNETPTQQLAKAKLQSEAAREARVRRQAYEEQLPEKEESLQTIDEQLADIEQQTDDWQIRWEAFLDQLSFPREWNVHLASKILSGLAEARNDWDKATDLDTRVADMESGIESFRQSVHALCDELVPDLIDFVPEHAMDELQSRLAKAKAADRDQHQLAISRDKLRKRQQSKESQLGGIDVELDQLFKLAGVDGETNFYDIASAATRRAELIELCREATTEINAIRGTTDEVGFTQELSELDSDSVRIEIERITEELTQIERDYDTAHGRATLLEQDRKNLDGVSRAAEIAVDLESTRSQLASAVDRWAPLVLAQSLMKQALKKFERDHQPAMLGEVERLLDRMTLGRYTKIERKLDEYGTLLVVDEQGKRKQPHQLSTGTREQLYLAIRLAYINHYCNESEPLPIVMDDVLVNFDIERAKQTLQVLAEFSEQVQIIFLTCHQHMIELVSDVMPKSKPVILPGGKLADGLVVASRGKKPRSTPAIS